MKTLVGWLMAAVMAVGVAGCTTTSGGGSGMPCEQCTYGYVPVKKSSERRVWCVIDGKTVDCQKDPTACPGCAGHKVSP